ncbi:MAG: molybdate ABC transporter substrate-binding protein [Pseudomonadota bacterium]
MKPQLIKKKPFWLMVIIVLMLCTSSNARQQDDSIIIFSAGSTTNAITDIAAFFSKQTHIKTITSFASSSTLARQIENGAPAHVYLSANTKWMDYLENKKMLEPGTRFNLLTNQIVLIAPADSPLKPVTIEKNFPLTALIGDQHMAMGDPDHVPSGIYGKQAMEFLGIWKTIEKQIVRTKDVRAALVLVAREEVPVGQVYSTDAAISDKVKIIGIFPDTSHSPIVYPTAIIAGKRTPQAIQFLKFLSSDDAQGILKKYGFQTY